MKFSLVATLRDGSEIESDLEDATYESYDEFRKSVVNLMSGDSGYLTIRHGNTLTVVGRSDLMTVSLVEVEDGTQ